MMVTIRGSGFRLYPFDSPNMIPANPAWLSRTTHSLQDRNSAGFSIAVWNDGWESVVVDSFSHLSYCQAYLVAVSIFFSFEGTLRRVSRIRPVQASRPL